MSRYESHAQRLLSSDESHPSPSMLLGALPFEFDVTITLGRQDDPFHLFPISLFCPWGSADFSIRNLRTGATLKGGDLAPWLIRTACFFEGSVPYRIDPRAAVEVLFGGG